MQQIWYIPICMIVPKNIIYKKKSSRPWINEKEHDKPSDIEQQVQNNPILCNSHPTTTANHPETLVLSGNHLLVKVLYDFNYFKTW